MKYKTGLFVFDIIESTLKFIAGAIILKIMFGFSRGMLAWIELDKLL